MRKMVNTVHIEGRIYEHNLTLKTVQNQQSANYGKEFISGTIDVAVDDEGMNIVQHHFTFVKATTNAGAVNATFNFLKKIIEDNKTWMTVGADEAQKIVIDASIALNDFYNREDNLVSAKRSEGGFVKLVTAIAPDVNKRHRFTTDMVISGVQEIEANEERQIPQHVSLRGYVFDFRGAVLPVDFIVESESGMKYFSNLGIEPSKPVFTQVWGNINGIKQMVAIEKEAAFGETLVQEVERSRKTWTVTGAFQEPYEFGGKDLTAEELQKMLADRETYLATVKARNEEYKASVAASSASPAPSAGVTSAPFSF